MANEITPEQAQRAREEFQRALDTAVAPYDLGQLLLFEESEEEFIRKEVERKLYESKLPNGGDRERKIVERLKKMSMQRDWDGSWRAEVAMRAWQKVLPPDPRNPGYYYICHPLRPSQDKETYEWLILCRDAATHAKQWDKKWFAELMLEGLPEPVADFKLECFYLLECSNGDVSRMVQLTNILGETTGKVLMDSEAFHAPKDFRRWGLKRGAFNWGAGEKELQKLHLDIGRLAAWRRVKQIVTLGWHPLSRDQTPSKTELKGIWFFGDCARIAEQWAQPDEDGIYWHRLKDKDGNLIENGYKVSDEGRENPFHQKKPMLHPRARISSEALDLAPAPEIGFKGHKGTTKGELMLESKDLEALEFSLYQAFFREMCARLTRIVGSMDALFLIGSFLSYAAAPELFDELSQFPGLWCHGEANSGKSTIIKWLMEIWGFRVLGMNLKGTNSTAVGMLQAADQYANLPVWVDEFVSDKEQVGKEKLAVLHNAFNRAGQAKFNPSGIQRSMRTTFVVSGESTTSEAALRGRYPHVQISKHMRQGTDAEKQADFEWFGKHSRYFFFIGRYLIEHREEFVAQVQRFFENWSREDIDPRLRIVHGIGYAAWVATVGLLSSHAPEEVKAFRNHMVEHSKKATDDVQSDLNVNVFAQDLIVAVCANEIPWDCLRVESEYLAHAPGRPNQKNWYSYKIFVNPEPTIAALQIFLRKQNQTIVLKRKDLRDQLSKNDFWINPPEGKKLNKRFSTGATGVVSAWGIYADKHPLGYQPISDEEFEEAQKNLARNGDPRKGPLFQLIDKVLAEQNKEG